MKFKNLVAESGSAIVEFIAFVVIGQLLAFSGAMTTAELLDRKVRLELFVSQLARAQAIGQARTAFEVLSVDYSLQGIQVSEVSCRAPLVCLSATLDDSTAFGVSYRNGQ